MKQSNNTNNISVQQTISKQDKQLTLKTRDYLGMNQNQQDTHHNKVQTLTGDLSNQLELKHDRHTSLSEHQCLLPFRKKTLEVFTRPNTEQLLHNLMLEHQQNQQYGLEDKEHYYTVINYITLLEDAYLKNGG